jgi:hypothetical protein
MSYKPMWWRLCAIFPPSFFDIMVHRIVHLVHEIKMCMYPFERFMGILKHYVRNRARPEGSIVQGYVTEEVIEFCLDYMARLDPVGGLSTRGNSHESERVERSSLGRVTLDIRRHILL